MTSAYHRTATVQFAINGTDQTITINDLPYLWIPAADGSAEQSAVFAARDWARKHLQFAGGLNVIMVSTSPQRPPMAASLALTKRRAIA